MAYFDQPGAWTRYNATQLDRPPRELAQLLVQHAGDGGGRLALDLGFGSGIETALLLAHGWRVLAIDADPAAAASLRGRVPDAPLTVRTQDFADLRTVPPVHLVHAAWSLPYAGVHLRRVWSLVRGALAPGGWVGCDLFGERDTTADAADVARLSDADVAAFLDGLAVVHHEVLEADGTSFGGPQHWHVHSVVGRRPPG